MTACRSRWYSRHATEGWLSTISHRRGLPAQGSSRSGRPRMQGSLVTSVLSTRAESGAGPRPACRRACKAGAFGREACVLGLRRHSRHSRRTTQPSAAWGLHGQCPQACRSARNRAHPQRIPQGWARTIQGKLDRPWPDKRAALHLRQLQTAAQPAQRVRHCGALAAAGMVGATQQSMPRTSGGEAKGGWQCATARALAWRQVASCLRKQAVARPWEAHKHAFVAGKTTACEQAAAANRALPSLPCCMPC